MTTTRHLLNHQRRLASRPAQQEGSAAATAATAVADRPARTAAAAEPMTEPATDRAEAAEPSARRGPAAWLRAPWRATAACAAATVVLGGFAAWSLGHASDLRSDADTHNTALIDAAGTASVSNSITQSVNSLFSYDYTDPAKTDSAAKSLLTGAAVKQYATMLAPVKSAAATQKLVLTTTVTNVGVEQLDGSRALLLVYADQRDTSTATTAGSAAQTSEAPAMFTVSAVRHGSDWLISSIGTFS